jgi:peptidoglycan/LPS O-acetylase OafA/YrhL
MIQLVSGPGFFRLFLAVVVVLVHDTRLHLGTMVVYLFFILSGYWISRLWENVYSRKERPWRTYLLSRAWRLWPMFFLCVVSVWGWRIYKGFPLPADINWFHQIVSNFLVFGYSYLSFQANSPAWSLDIEAQYYLLAPSLLFLMRRSLGALLGCALVSLVFVGLGLGPNIGFYLFFFGLGAAGAVSGWTYSPKWAWLSLVGTIALIVGVYFSPWSAILISQKPLHPFARPFNVICALTILPWLFYTVKNKGCRWDQAMGDFSYPLYLFHWPLLFMIGVKPAFAANPLKTIMETFPSVFAISFLIWFAIDRPVNAWRKRWVKAQP